MIEADWRQRQSTEPPPAVGKKPSTFHKTCGTISGTGVHNRYGEANCRPCKDAWAEYKRNERRTKTQTVEREGKRNAVNYRIITLLREGYPELFEQLQAEARAQMGASRRVS